MKTWWLAALAVLLPGVALGDEACNPCRTAHFESTPAGATVTASYGDAAHPQTSQCVTPCTLSLPTGSAVRFSAELKGYRIAPGGPNLSWRDGHLRPDPATVVFEPIPDALKAVAPPTALPAPSDTPAPVSAPQPTALPSQHDIVLSALRRHAGPYLLLAPYIPAPIVQNVARITGQPTDDLLAVLDITNLHNGKNGLYFYPDRVVSKSPAYAAATIYYTSLIGRTPRAGMFDVDYGDGLVLEANFGLQRRVMLTVDDILVSLTALPDVSAGVTDDPDAGVTEAGMHAARCRPDMIAVTFAPDSLAVPEGLMPMIVEDRPGCAIASVRVVGYANTLASADQNQALSVQRAGAVQAALVAAGVSADKISVEAHGDSELPVHADESGPQPIGRPTLVIVGFN